jgi:hypothetical protein
VFSEKFNDFPNVIDFLEPDQFPIYSDLVGLFSKLNCNQNSFLILFKIALSQHVKNFNMQIEHVQNQHVKNSQDAN